MKIFNIDDMKGGWFIGNFEPSMLKTNDCEVAVKKHKAGTVDQKHHHKVATEFTLIIKGKAEMNGVELNVGQGVVIPPGFSVEFVAIEDTETVVVKMPGASNDKYLD